MKCRELIRADWSRFRTLSGQAPGGAWKAPLHPRTAPVFWFRISAKLHSMALRPLAQLVYLANLILFRVEIPPHADIGGGLVLPHPGGIVLGSARIGRNVTIYQNVTLGARSFDPHYDLSIRPVIDDEAVIGANAVVLGPVTVHKGATVKANSLTTQDVLPREAKDA